MLLLLLLFLLLLLTGFILVIIEWLIANGSCLPPFCSNNVWAKCPPGMFMQGIKRTGRLYSWLSNIEELICCSPKDAKPSYEDCHEKNVSFIDQGWAACDFDYYLAGFHRGNCRSLSCLDRFKCCKFKTRGMVDMLDSFRAIIFSKGSL